MNKFPDPLKEPLPSFTYAISCKGLYVHYAVKRT